MIKLEYRDAGGTNFDHMLVLKSDGLELEIGFNGLDAAYIYINGIEMDVNSDDYKGLYVRFGEVVPVANVIQQANAQIESIVSEIADEEASLEAMADELSSPYLTGRI